MIDSANKEIGMRKRMIKNCTPFQQREEAPPPSLRQSFNLRQNVDYIPVEFEK